MEKQSFNPHNPKYEKVGDLPKKEQANYSDVEGGGFVKKEAAEFYKIAQDIERITKGENGSISADKFMMLLAQDEDKKREWDALTGKQQFMVLIGNPKGDMDLSTWNTNHSAIEKTLEEHPELKDDKELMLKLVVSGTSQAPGLASEKLRNNKEYALEAVKRNGMALGCLPEEMQDNEDVVMVAVTKRGLALREASPRLQNNREIVVAAITSEDGHLEDIQYASDEVIEGLLDENNPANKDILLKAMNNKHFNDDYKRIASYNPNHPDYQGGQYEKVFKRYEHLHMREKIEKILGENL